MAKFKRPFRLSLTDADGVLINTWQLEQDPEDEFEAGYVQEDGTMDESDGMYLGEDVAREVTKAAKL